MPRPRLHDDALRTRLLEAASEVISDGGPRALTVRDVAGRAGTSASAVYALFGSREALLDAVGEEAVRRFSRHLAAAGTRGDPGADLLALGLAYRRSALDDPHFYRVMFDTAGAGAQDPARPPATQQATFRTLQDAVARVLHASGAPAAAQASAAQEAAVGLWGLVHGLVLLELGGLVPGGPADAEARFARLLAGAGAGLLGGHVAADR